MSIIGGYPQLTLDPCSIRHIQRPLSQIDPNKVYGNGREIYATDDLNPEVTISHKTGNGITPYYRLTEQINSNDHILSGLGLSLSVDNTHVVVQPGSWLLDGVMYTLASATPLEIDARDGSKNRYDVLYVDNTGTVNIISGDLSTTPIEPTVPTGTLKIGSVLITPTSDDIIAAPPITNYVTTNTAQNISGVKHFTSPQYFDAPVQVGDQTIFGNHYTLADYSGGGVAGLFQYNSVSDPTTDYLFGFDASANHLIYGDSTGRFRLLDTRDLAGIGTSTGVNGLNGTTNIGLGGTLTNNTTIQLGTRSLLFNAINNSTTTLYLDATEFRTSSDEGTAGPNTSSFTQSGGIISFAGSDTSGTESLIINGSGFSSTSLNVGSEQTILTQDTNTFSVLSTDFLGDTTTANFNYFTGIYFSRTGGSGNSSNFNLINQSSTWSVIDPSVNTLSITLSETAGATIIDNIFSKGILYDNDYSSNFTARSLIDKGYADATYSTSSGVTAISIALSNGFTGTSSGGSTPVLTLSIQNATTSLDGKLSHTDWNTFNTKQTALSGTGFVKISGTTISYDNSTYLTTSSASSTYLALSGGNVTGDIQQSVSPVNSTSLITKGYVDNLIAGLQFIDKAADVASIANVNISSAPSSLDGVSGTSGVSRWLLKNQTTASENGVYLFNGTGSALTRTTDAITGSQLANKTIPVSSGSTQSDTWWTITNDSITIGVTAITIVQIAGSGTYTNGSGIALSGNIFSLDTTFTKGLLSATSPIFYNSSTGVISSQAGSASQNGYITSTDWSTFNNKQASGNYITALTGDATASGPNSVAITLATVNGSVGTFNNLTVNGKGLVTSASNVGYITGNQTITLTGNITGSGATTISTSIATGAVTNTMLAGSIDLTAKVTGILPVANGGSGTSTAFTTGSIVFAGASGTYTQNNNNLYFNTGSGILSVDTSGDTTGTDAINSYFQHDSYNPQSVIGSSVNGTSTPGITASTSRGTGISPVISNTGDVIGNHGFWAYSGSSPAYTNMAGMVGTTVGTTANNLGGQLDFYTKANNASTYTSWLTILNNGTLSSNAQATFNPSVSASSSLAQGFIYTPTLTAVANNDVLIGYDITQSVAGVGIISTLSAITTAGSSYTNGTYNGVALINGNGTGATANITISGAVVTVCTLVLGGTRFTVGDILSVAAASVGGTGSGFTITVASLTQTVTGAPLRTNISGLGQSTPIISGYFGDGLILRNTTAATSTLSQNSPTLRFQSFGWGTTAPASELAEWVMYATTASGTVPSTILNIRSIVNGTATSSTTTAQFQFSTSGTMTAATAFNALPGNLITTTKDAFNASNGSTATSGVPVQYGPGYSSQSNVWNPTATASQSVYMGWHMEPVSANPVSGIMVWSTKLNGGAEAKIMSLTSAGALGVGIGTAAAANIESLSTTEQLRLSYDGTNHSSFTTSSAGNLGITPSGGTVNITGALTVSQTVTLGNTNGNIYIGSAQSVFQNTGLAQFQYASSSTNSFRTAFYGSTSAILAANNNYANVFIASSQVTLPATGTTAWVVNEVINPLGTITNGSAIPLTNTATLFVGAASGAGTNNYTAYFDTGTVFLANGNLKLATAGNGIYVKEGTNATMGTGTLAAGTATISTTKVTANSRIFLSDEGGGVLANIGALSVGTKTAGTSFVVNSSNTLDTSNFTWIIFEPA